MRHIGCVLLLFAVVQLSLGAVSHNALDRPTADAAWVHGRATKSGTLAAAIARCAGGRAFDSGIQAVAEGSEIEVTTEGVTALGAFGAAAGGLLGVDIDSAVPKWHLEYLSPTISRNIHRETEASAESTVTSLEEQPIKSLSFPQIWKPHFGSMVVWNRRGVGDEVAGELNLGIYRDLINPVFGLFGLGSEGYVSTGGHKIDGGVRLLGVSRFFFIQAGADYSFRNKGLDFLMSLTLPLRRGGPLGKGGSVRFDWIPGRRHSLSLGLSIPVGQPYMGKSRPNLDHLSLPTSSFRSKWVYSPHPALRDALMNLRHAAHWINRFTAPFLDQSTKKDKSDIVAFEETIKEFKDHIHLKDRLYPTGHNFEAEVSVYHQEFQNAFSLAAGSADDDGIGGARIAKKAREVLLDEVILPYNRLLGQRKRHDSVAGLGHRAVQVFQAWIRESPDVPAGDRAAVSYVFHHIVQYIDQNRAESKKVWQDSRLVWIPLHFALRFEDHDTEDKLDAIIEKAVGQEFTHANDVHYVVNELFQPELERMILAAKDYHVLWIHDFSGTNKYGEPDEVSYRCAVHAYLQALIEKVREYDSTRQIPVYMIFLDQNYFERRHGRLWLELLEDPLGHKVRLPSRFKHWERTIRRCQDSLRSAVAESAALQAGAQRYGSEWLSNKIKVHINITNPSDLSFRSSSFFKCFPFVPDNLMRDHRKITFYDVTELDPGSGEAMYTGMGVGERYLEPTWDDRSILARGPALVSLKDAARDLLLSHGMEESEIPPPLRRLAKPQNYNDLLEELRAKGWTACAMQVHNVTGFGPKYASIIKAVLYSLMPNGSHLYIPDSLWNSPFWGALLVGASLRGCVVLVISPALANAPSAGDPQMSRANELFTRFLIVQDQMGEEIASAGGLFKTGIYSMDVDVGDILGKIRRLSDGVARSDVFRNVFPFAPAVVDMVAQLPEILESEGFQSSSRSGDEVKQDPKLHLKSQFFASQPVINTVVPLEGWETVVREYVIARAKQVKHQETAVDAKDLRKALKLDADMLIESWRKGLSPAEREAAIVYLIVGSHNQDYRSMIMDGEDLYVVGRTWAMVAYLDFVSLVGQTTWVENIQELEELLPRHKGFWKWLGRYLKLAL